MPDPGKRPRVLQMGPDPAIGGGMAAVLRGLLSSPLAARYELEVVPTYRSPKPLGMAAIFALSLLRLTAWSLRGRGRIVHIHATVRGSTYRKSLVVLVAKALRRRVVLHVHSGAGDVAFFAAGRDRLSLVLIKAGFAAADVVLAVSEASKAALEKAYGISGVEVVPNAAPTVAPFERRLPGPGEPVEVAYLGGFANDAKGGDVMVAGLELALEREPRLRVTMAGPGEPPPAATELFARGDAVEWAGWLEPEAKDALLRRAPVFAMPSRSEGLPMALLEAMAYGMAIASTAVGGIPEVLGDGEEGLLVPSEDPAALADALCRLAADAPLRERLAANALHRAKRLDEVEVSNRLAAIYESLT
jgi:glycosyltransferase involved in cell wall biosynthesis